MSVKKMLPIIGVGSAAALIGLVASRRAASQGAASSTSRQRPSGIMVRRSDGAETSEALQDLPDTPHGLPHGFWDAAPESTAEEPPSLPSRHMRERDESSDRDSLSAEWLARATQAPRGSDTDDDADDPAEIPADSLSMISDASRYAAARADDDDSEAVSER
jgi:hypothetical protein